MITLASVTCDTYLVEVISDVRTLVTLINTLRYPSGISLLLWNFRNFGKVFRQN